LGLWNQLFKINPNFGLNSPFFFPPGAQWKPLAGGPTLGRPFPREEGPGDALGGPLVGLGIPFGGSLTFNPAGLGIWALLGTNQTGGWWLQDQFWGLGGFSPEKPQGLIAPYWALGPNKFAQPLEANSLPDKPLGIQRLVSRIDGTNWAGAFGLGVARPDPQGFRARGDSNFPGGFPFKTGFPWGNTGNCRWAPGKGPSKQGGAHRGLAPRPYALGGV